MDNGSILNNNVNALTPESRVTSPESRFPDSESRIPNPEIAISVQNLTKIYKLYDSPVDRLKEALHPLRRKYHHDFHALNDVSFEVKKGETVGILGKNGSGKSTLLKLIAGVLTPTSGSVTVNGRVSALLELGTGFNPELTGIENVYFNGTLMGYTREEMDEKLDSILSFADIGEYVFQPVKMYSSGMFARLAFALSVQIDPEILIVDEALSVGDMQFQEKAVGKMKALIGRGSVVIFVTHSLPMVRNFCTRGMWINNGNIAVDDASAIVCETYDSFCRNDNNTNSNISNLPSISSSNIYIKSVVLHKMDLITSDDIEIVIDIGYKITPDIFGIGVIIRNDKNEIVTICSTVRDDLYAFGLPDQVKLLINENDLLMGKYVVEVSITDDKCIFHYDRIEEAVSFTIRNKTNKFGLPVSEGHFRGKHKWIFEP